MKDDNSLTIAYMCGYNDAKRSTTPEGWKPVPVEPTYDMTQAGVNLALSARISGAYPWPTYIRDMYKTMLSAAPKFGEE